METTLKAEKGSDGLENPDSKKKAFKILEIRCFIQTDIRVDEIRQ